MILEQDDFLQVPYRIPNQSESKDFQDFIDKRETYYLKKILGLDLYRLFKTGFDGIASPDQIWMDLAYGTNEETNPDGDGDYEYGSYNYEYLGLVEVLRPAIYADWLKENYRTWDNSGVVMPTGQNNATIVMPDVEITKSWNEFVNFLGSPICQQNTLYGFLFARTLDYPTWQDGIFFEQQYYRNQFDL